MPLRLTDPKFNEQFFRNLRFPVLPDPAPGVQRLCLFVQEDLEWAVKTGRLRPMLNQTSIQYPRLVVDVVNKSEKEEVKPSKNIDKKELQVIVTEEPLEEVIVKKEPLEDIVEEETEGAVEKNDKDEEKIIKKDEVESDENNGESIDGNTATENNTVRCICGTTLDHENLGWVQCDGCKFWEHIFCGNYDAEKEKDDKYYCHICEVENDKPKRKRPAATKITRKMVEVEKMNKKEDKPVIRKSKATNSTKEVFKVPKPPNNRKSTNSSTASIPAHSGKSSTKVSAKRASSVIHIKSRAEKEPSSMPRAVLAKKDVFQKGRANSVQVSNCAVPIKKTRRDAPPIEHPPFKVPAVKEESFKASKRRATSMHPSAGESLSCTPEKIKKANNGTKYAPRLPDTTPKLRSATDNLKKDDRKEVKLKIMFSRAPGVKRGMSAISDKSVRK